MIQISQIAAEVHLGSFNKVTGVRYVQDVLMIYADGVEHSINTTPFFDRAKSNYADVKLISPMLNTKELKNFDHAEPIKHIRFTEVVRIEVTDPEIYSDFETRKLRILTHSGLIFTWDLHSDRHVVAA